MNSTFRTASCSALFLFATLAGGADRPRRNVVLMIADGAGFNSWKATAMYEGTVGAEFHDAEGWTRLAQSTHSLRNQRESPVSAEHGLTQIAALVYDPEKAWDPTPVEGGELPYPFSFAGYRWLRLTAPDSANTMSAMVTGRKTFRGSINVDGAGVPVEETLASLAHDAGMLVGSVTTVPFADATPAAASGAHQASRTARCELAVEMLTGAYPDLIAGCCNPGFDHNARPLEKTNAGDYAWIGGREVWDVLTGKGRLEAGQPLCAIEVAGVEQSVTLDAAQVAALESWTLVEARPAIESLQNGETPERLLVVPQVGWGSFWSGSATDPANPYNARMGGTLQQQRGSRADSEYTDPGYDPPNDVPSLESLTRVALNALEESERGFFLHVEGGAVDWAMHENQFGRMVEELMDFKRSVAAVIEWIESHGGWEETLLVVTADHDHMLWGPNANSIPFDPIVDNGAGRLPSYRWLASVHSNALVPLYARGVGADRFETLAADEDPFRGRYCDQTDVFRVIRAALSGPAD